MGWSSRRTQRFGAGAPQRLLNGFAGLVLGWAAWLAAPGQAATLDPNIRMHTLDTPHFHVHYPEGYEAIAQKAAQFAEEAHDRVSAYFGTQPLQKTELTLFDHEDTVNGLALPYVTSAMYVYLTAPDADFMWGRYDDWLKLVITHEYTHALHFETVSGPTAALNRIFGRFLFPNLFQPTFLIEGLAVTTESMFTNQGRGGRGNDGYFDMYLRGDVLEGRLLTIDQAATYHMTDFPGGDAPYVYGTFFYKYIVQRYGADKPAAIARAYGEAPWLGIDAAVARVLGGRDAQQIWDETIHWIKRRARAQIAAIRRRPVTLTTAVTTSGMHHRHPAYLPNGHLIFVEGLRHGPAMLKERVGIRDGQPQLVPLARKSHVGCYDLTPDGRAMLFSDSHGRNNYSSFEDVFLHDFVTGERKNLTQFARLGQPGLSRDGTRILAVQNGKGQNDLVLLDREGKLLRRLTQLQDHTQITAPRWSPDDRHAVFSAWRGSSRDLFLLDTATGQAAPLWKDDAVDIGPVWTPDGRYIVFASDREGGVFNLFAYDWQARNLWQVTNVLTGVCEPAIRPDGQEIAMAYCRGLGFDIHTLPFTPDSWRPVPHPTADPSVVPYVHRQRETYPSSPYSPWPSLLPKFWLPLYQATPASIGAFTLGYDVLITNLFFAHAGWSLQGDGYLDPDTNTFQGFSLFDRTLGTFLYQNTQYDTNVNAFANWYPMRYSVPLRDGSVLTPFQRFANLSLGLGWNNLPSPLTNASYQTGDVHALNLNVRLIQDLTPEALAAPLKQARVLPPAGRAHSLSYVYRFNDNGRFGYSVSPEYGSLGSAGLEVAHPWLGSEVDYYKGFLDYRRFVPLPLTHHVLAFRGLGGLNLGKPQGDFFLGGTRPVNPNGSPDIRVAADPDDVLIGLRGYPLASVNGNVAALASAEYRFPLLELQHGAGTLPLFAERLGAAVFSDAGLAWNADWATLPGAAPSQGASRWPTSEALRLGLGAEFRLNFKISNNPLNTNPIATVWRMAWPGLNAFNDSSGVARFGVAQGVLPGLGGVSPTPTLYFDMGTYF
ncbi:MAG: BamA/TamA family outer membrane protein [Candidatus Sericytochromatia bacterium]|nr:BamA/TamA family outer membrane protein [Candidatus Sericytochromatia bacterium]